MYIISIANILQAMNAWAHAFLVRLVHTLYDAKRHSPLLGKSTDRQTGTNTYTQKHRTLYFRPKDNHFPYCHIINKNCLDYSST